MRPIIRRDSPSPRFKRQLLSNAKPEDRVLTLRQLLNRHPEGLDGSVARFTKGPRHRLCHLILIDRSASDCVFTSR